MTTFWVQANGDSFSTLMKLAVYDTGFATAMVAPAHNRAQAFIPVMADLMLCAGLAQPTNSDPRRVTRADLGRLTFGLNTSAREAVVLEAGRLTVGDARLLQLGTGRAQVDLWLVGEGRANLELRAWLDAQATTVDAQDAIRAWSTRASCGGRRDAWKCQAYLDHGSTINAGCTIHRDPIDCVLAWFPHAIATARATPAQVRSTLFELACTRSEDQWRVWAHARDHYRGLARAAQSWEVPGADLAALTISDVASDASVLQTRSGPFTVPEAHRALAAAHRAVLLADGYDPSETFIQVSAPNADRYVLRRSGDPVPA